MDAIYKLDCDVHPNKFMYIDLDKILSVQPPYSTDYRHYKINIHFQLFEKPIEIPMSTIEFISHIKSIENKVTIEYTNEEYRVLEDNANKEALQLATKRFDKLIADWKQYKQDKAISNVR